jgi:hypothetical protein
MFAWSRVRAFLVVGACTLAAPMIGGEEALAQTPREDFYVTNGGVAAELRVGTTLYIGGSFTQVAPASGGGVRFDNSTGLLVPNLPKVAGAVDAAASDGSGGWFIGGRFTAVGGVPRHNLAHVLANGSVAAWNPDPGAVIFPENAFVLAIAVAGGTVYVSGGFDTMNGLPRHRFAALDSSTGVVTAWDPNANEYANALVVTPWAVYAGGQFTTVNGGTARNYLAAFDPVTGLANAWNPSPNNTVATLALSGATVYVGGAFTTIGGATRNRIAALDAATGSATAWDPNANDVVFALALSGSTLYAGGDFTTVDGGLPRDRLAAFDASTGLATAWNPGANNHVSDLAVGGGTVYVGGQFTSVGGGAQRNFLAAIDASTGVATAWNPNPNKISVRALEADGSSVYVGGEFTAIGGVAVARNNLAAFDTVTGMPTAWDPNVNGAVSALALNFGAICAGGSFTIVNGGLPRNRLAAFDGTGSATSWNPNVNNIVNALAVSSAGNLYAGGRFTTVNGGLARNRLAAFDVNGTATGWNPSPNTIVGPPAVGVVALAASGGTIYAGGDFTTIGGATRNRIAALDATTGAATPWNPNASGVVRTLVVSGGTVYAGGDFTAIGGATRNRIAALDAATGSATAWDPNANGAVLALALSGSTLYAGGRFTIVNGGTTRNALAEFDATTGIATAWDPNAYAPVSLFVRALALDSAGTVYAGGDFYAIGGRPQAFLAAIVPVAASYTITASSGPNGTIAPTGTLSVAAGTSQTFTITPDPCYLADVYVDGTAIGDTSTYTFDAVSGDHTITANFVPADGTSCSDENACTQTDTCLAGVCVGANPVTCSALDQCHVAGTCDTGTGICSNPAEADGAGCGDGNACTQTDTCQAGTCVGANPVTCSALDQCHVVGTCNPTSGVCSNPTQSDGVGCSDGNACTQTDTCQAGACTGSNYSWSGFLQPVNTDGSSVFKLGSTIPVKFDLTGGCAGNASLVANIYFYHLTNSSGPVNEAVSTSAADTGTLFRYNGGHYMFNLGTKDVTGGTWQLGVDLHDGVGIRTVPVGLRP